MAHGARRWLRPSPFWTAAIIAIAYLVLGLVTLTAFPIVWMDEPWLTQSAWSYSAHGTFSLPMFGDLVGSDHDNVVFGRVYLLAIASIFELGGVSPYTARLFSFISALVAVVAVYGIGRELWSPRVAAIAAILLAIAPVFVVQSHDARPEIPVVAAWTIALYLVLRGERTDSNVLLCAGGLVAALAGDLHFNGLAAVPALLLVLLARRVRPRMVAAYVVGVAVGAVWWLWVHVLSDTALFQDQMAVYGRRPPILDAIADPVTFLLSDILRFAMVQPGLSVFLVVLGVVAAISLLWKRRDRGVTSLVVFAATVFAFMVIVQGSKTPIYAVLLWPVWALLVARLVEVSSRPLAIATGGLVIVTSLWGIWRAYERDQGADYDGYVASVRSVIPSDATVEGNETLWYGFTEQPFIGHHYFEFAGPYEEEVRRLGIDYIVADEYFLRAQLHGLGEIDPGPVETFLRDHARLVAEIEDPFYGWVSHGGRGSYLTRVYEVLDADATADGEVP